MQASPYLLFNGQCEEAFKFYEKCLGGKIEGIMTFAQSPMARQVPPEWGNKVMHACLKVDGMTLLGSDPPPDRYEQPQGFSVSLSIKEPAETERIFHELAQNGKVKMPVQQTFWSVRFGMLVDQFGIPWIVNCEQAAAHAG
ncbi:MAG TPA: VOC family protein [Candidatus Acidoferrum sp.]|nr:VOC family protein [Candidatus Acidoferrum sp.]